MRIDQALLEQARDAVVFVQGAGGSTFTLRQLIEEGVKTQLKRIRRTHGVDIPPRSTGSLRPGRRIA